MYSIVYDIQNERNKEVRDGRLIAAKIPRNYFNKPLLQGVDVLTTRAQEEIKVPAALQVSLKHISSSLWYLHEKH